MGEENSAAGFFENDQFSKYIGIDLLEVTGDSIKARLNVKEHHLNGVNIVHGGALFTLADVVFGALGYRHDRTAVSINASISYFKAVTGGILIAEGKLVTLTPKLGSYTVQVTDEQGDVIAVFQGLGYRRQKKAAGERDSK